MDKPAAFIDTCVVLTAMGVNGPARQAEARSALKQVIYHMQGVNSPATREHLVYLGTHADIAQQASVKPATFIGDVCRLQKLVRPSVQFHLCKTRHCNDAIEAAVSGNARWLITTDTELLVTGRIGATRIVTPEKFLQAVKPKQAQPVVHPVKSGNRAIALA